MHIYLQVLQVETGNCIARRRYRVSIMAPEDSDVKSAGLGLGGLVILGTLILLQQTITYTYMARSPRNELHHSHFVLRLLLFSALHAE